MDPRFETIKKKFEETGNSYHSTSAGMYINLRIPPSYFHLNSPKQLEGVDEEPTLLLTFGTRWGGIHVEERCYSGCAQLDFGEKEWWFWPPGPKPKTGTKPHLVLHQQKGDLVIVVGGWYHKVFTKNGGQLSGVIWPGPLINTIKCAESGYFVSNKELLEIACAHGVKLPAKTSRTILVATLRT